MSHLKIFQRFLKHTFAGRRLVRSYFPKKVLKAIEEEIKSSEEQHRAEIRVAVEANFNFSQIYQKMTSLDRAVQVFSDLRIWDTRENNGVLVYILLVERKIEIVADRGIYKKLGKDYWAQVNQQMVKYFKEKKYKEGVIYSLKEITNEMVKLFPKQGEDPDELPDSVVIL